MERAAIVTGGGTGIGRATAIALHRDGYRVLVAGRRPEPLEETRALLGDGCETYPGDIRDPDVSAGLVEECMTRFGRIDCLVNNAGGQFTAAAEDISPGGWRAVRRLNLDAPWFLTQAVAKRWMIANGGGRVISVVLCPERGIAGMAHSSAARAGMGGLTRTLAMEWGRYGIGLVCVAPGVDRHGGRGRLRPRPGCGGGHDPDAAARRRPGGGRPDRLPGVAGGDLHHRRHDRRSTAAST